MKKILVASVFLLIFSRGICQETIIGRVVKIADGDTFTILVGGQKKVKIRLHGIDCPEKGQDFGTQSTKFTSSLCFKQIVKVQVTDNDRYGRKIGIVKLFNGLILNEALLQAGLAWHYTRYDKSKRYAALEQKARSDRRGIWSTKNPVAPWVFKRNN